MTSRGSRDGWNEEATSIKNIKTNSKEKLMKNAILQNDKINGKKESKKHRKRQREMSNANMVGDDHDKRNKLANFSNDRQRRNGSVNIGDESFSAVSASSVERSSQEHANYTYILAPMVGASELPFRFLCRKYGTQLCYTPMMSAQQFASSQSYRNEYFATNKNTSKDDDDCDVVHFADHPIYAHVYANTVDDFVAAAKQAVKMKCDGLDLNLGCPQRTAYIGHYGSYLCTEDASTHTHVANMLSSAVRAIQNQIPITAKIRLLHPKDVQPTLQLCRTLHNEGNGTSLIAIHARQRASWERTGPSARDGPADLQQVSTIVKELTVNNHQQHSNCPRLRIVTNGNTITYDDVLTNLQLTQADGIMSAEGLLDNPALYLPRYDQPNVNHNNTFVTIWTLKEEYRYKYINYSDKGIKDSDATTTTATTAAIDVALSNGNVEQTLKNQIQKIELKIENIEQRMKQTDKAELSNKQSTKLDRYRKKLKKIRKKLTKIQNEPKETTDNASSNIQNNSNTTNCNDHRCSDQPDPYLERRTVTLQSLYDIANDKVLLAMEYLDWAIIYTTSIRTIVFHVRRMCKNELQQYQLLQECLAATTIEQIRNILDRIISYRIHPETFIYDSQRAKEEKDAIQRQKIEEGKRKAYEERMIRKAKREGKDDLFYYLNIGAKLPTTEQMGYYKTLDRDVLLPIWKREHSQHCISYHMDVTKCPRGRSCAFLHVDATNATNLQEKDECAG